METTISDFVEVGRTFAEYNGEIHALDRRTILYRVLFTKKSIRTPNLQAKGESS